MNPKRGDVIKLMVVMNHARVCYSAVWQLAISKVNNDQM